MTECALERASATTMSCPEVCLKVRRELFDELQVTEQSWRAFISAMLESMSERLLIRKDEKETALAHMSEVLDDLIHCLDLAVLRTVLLFSRTKLMGEESQGFQPSWTRCCKAAPIAISEASVNTANVEGVSG